MILPIWPQNGCFQVFLCATCLDSEPLHFSSKSVEILHASLCDWSLMNKVTLDLSRYGWKSLVGDTTCCNFFLIVICISNFENVETVMKFFETWCK